jgi:LysM repeat protein
MTRPLAGSIALAALLLPAASLAQQGPTDNGGGETAPSTTPPTTTVYPGVVAPPPDGAPIGGGNATESSARPVSGDKEDTFDNGPPMGETGTVVGGKGGAVFFDNHPSSRVLGQPATSSVHTVQKGDTLWGICDAAFQNPYQWPRIWSYNPQIQNPHWIYPNEQIRLKPGVSLEAMPQVAMPEGGGAGVMTGMQQRVPHDTVFLREEGFVNEDAGLNWGSIVGSPQDRMYLSDFDQVYVRVGPDHDVKIGQELTVYRPVRQTSDGQVIAIQGTLRVDDWNAESRIARAQIVETLDAIERGARVGPIPRKFIVVPPLRNDADVTAHVLIASHPHVFYGQDQVVFIDQGSDAGLKAGNRLFVVRHGDAWWKSQVTTQTGRRIVGEREDPAAVENLPHLQDDSALPEEVVAELRVLDVQKKSATCLVSQSAREIEPKDVAVARKGY